MFYMHNMRRSNLILEVEVVLLNQTNNNVAYRTTLYVEVMNGFVKSVWRLIGNLRKREFLCGEFTTQLYVQVIFKAFVAYCYCSQHQIFNAQTDVSITLFVLSFMFNDTYNLKHIRKTIVYKNVYMVVKFFSLTL